MYPFPKRGLPPTLDSLENEAPSDPYSRWCGGVITAAIPVVIGVLAAVGERAYFLSRSGGIAEYGAKDAIALGVACIAIGLLLHSHYFWAASSRYFIVSQILKPIALLLLAGAMIFVVLNQMVFG